jgi:hypothetical protein
MMRAERIMQTVVWILLVAANMAISLGLFDIRVVAVLASRHSRALRSYSSNAIAGEQRHDTGGRRLATAPLFIATQCLASTGDDGSGSAADWM